MPTHALRRVATTRRFTPRSAALAAFVAAASLAPAGPTSARAQGTPPTAGTPFQPLKCPSLQVSRASGRIDIDGDLDDQGWIDAARAAGWTEFNPGDQVQPPVASEALVTYDENNLYLAFVAHDDAGSVRSTLSDRDDMFSDDNIGLLLDTYGDGAWAYEIFFNPLGIQGDGRWTPNNEDMRFDIVMTSKGKITPGGWQVEAAIPFSSLRFPDRGEQTWRATFIRTHPRDSRRQYSWATIDRDDPCLPCQFGTWNGIRGVRRSTSLEFLPAITGSQFGERQTSLPGTPFHNDKMDADVALGVRYSLTSSIVADATLNPDFSQVESDAAQIDVNTTFALFYPERRPFFQEGSDLFDSWIDAVYTRSLNDPQGAVKLTGRMNRSSLAYIGARDAHTPIVLPFEERSEYLQAGKSTSNILRAKQTFLQDSFAGALVTDQRLDGGGSGTVLGGDVSLRVLKNYRLKGQLLFSRTGEPRDAALTQDLAADPGTATFERGKHTTAFDGESYWGDAAYASIQRDARLWQVDLEYWETSPTFRAANGFVTQNDNRRAMLSSGLDFRPNDRILDEVIPSANIARVWNFDGVRKDEWLRPELYLRFKKQTRLTLATLWSNERFRGREFPGIRRWSLNLQSDYVSRFRPGVYMEAGKRIARNPSRTFGHPDPVPFLGDGLDVSAWATIKPLQRLVISPEYSFSQLRYPHGGEFDFRGYILRTRFNYQFTRELFLRLVVQYNDFSNGLDLDPLLTFKLNPFTVAYVGSTHDLRELDGSNNLTETQRQFFLKFQYLFRL